MTSKTTKTPNQFCRRCFRNIGAATSFEGRTPGEGAISLCMYCGTLGVYGADLIVRPPTEQQQAEILKRADVQQVLQALTIIRSRN